MNKADKTNLCPPALNIPPGPPLSPNVGAVGDGPLDVSAQEGSLDHLLPPDNPSVSGEASDSPDHALVMLARQNEQAEEANTLLQSQLAAEKLKTVQLENQLSAGNGIDSYSKEIVPFILQ